MMKLEGRITLDQEEIKRAVAEYINRVHGTAVEPEKVSVYPDAADRYELPKCVATVVVGVSIASSTEK